MILLIDSREKKPLEFKHPWITAIEVAKLEVGDYAVRFKDGYSPPVFFERKSIGDLFGTMGKGYKRFKREIGRSQELNAELHIVMEGSYSKILKGYSHSLLEGLSVIKQLLTLRYRYKIEHHWFNSRENMAHYIVHSFITLGKEHTRRKRESLR